MLEYRCVLCSLVISLEHHNSIRPGTLMYCPEHQEQVGRMSGSGKRLTIEQSRQAGEIRVSTLSRDEIKTQGTDVFLSLEEWRKELENWDAEQYPETVQYYSYLIQLKEAYLSAFD